MKTILSNCASLIRAVALLVTGASGLSAAEGPMGKPAVVAFPPPIWKWSDKPSEIFPFDQIIEVNRLGTLAEAGEIQGKVVFLELTLHDEIAADKWLERRDLCIQILFPGIAKEDVMVAEPDPKKSPQRSVITCKQENKSYLVIFAPFNPSSVPKSEMRYMVTVGDTAFFKNAADLSDRKVSDEQRSKILKTLFEKE